MAKISLWQIVLAVFPTNSFSTQAEAFSNFKLASKKKKLCYRYQVNCSNVVFKVQQQLAKLQKHLQNKISSLKRLFLCKKTGSDPVSTEAPICVASVCHISAYLNIFLFFFEKGTIARQNIQRQQGLSWHLMIPQDVLCTEHSAVRQRLTVHSLMKAFCDDGSFCITTRLRKN